MSGGFTGLPGNADWVYFVAQIWFAGVGTLLFLVLMLGPTMHVSAGVTRALRIVAIVLCMAWVGWGLWLLPNARDPSGMLLTTLLPPVGLAAAWWLVGRAFARLVHNTARAKGRERTLRVLVVVGFLFARVTPIGPVLGAAVSFLSMVYVLVRLPDLPRTVSFLGAAMVAVHVVVDLVLPAPPLVVRIVGAAALFLATGVLVLGVAKHEKSEVVG